MAFTDYLPATEKFTPARLRSLLKFPEQTRDWHKKFSKSAGGRFLGVLVSAVLGAAFAVGIAYAATFLVPTLMGGSVVMGSVFAALQLASIVGASTGLLVAAVGVNQSLQKQSQMVKQIQTKPAYKSWLGLIPAAAAFVIGLPLTLPFALAGLVVDALFNIVSLGAWGRNVGGASSNRYASVEGDAFSQREPLKGTGQQEPVGSLFPTFKAETAAGESFDDEDEDAYDAEQRSLSEEQGVPPLGRSNFKGFFPSSTTYPAHEGNSQDGDDTVVRSASPTPGNSSAGAATS